MKASVTDEDHGPGAIAYVVAEHALENVGFAIGPTVPDGDPIRA